MTAHEARSPCRWHEDTPLLPPDAVRDLGRVLVVAPHPDDEVLGCGGAVGLLRRAGIAVRVIIASDGAASHPGSKTHPPATLAALRRGEAEAGLAILGVSLDHVTFLGLPDGAVPYADAAGGRRAVAEACAAVRSWPDVGTVLLPWRRDPHDDHRATWSLFSTALDTLASPARRLEYPIWSWVHPGPGDAPVAGEARVWRLDISPVQAQKRAAILAHRSQTTEMIDDAEIGECLTADVLERFFQPWEIMIEFDS